MAFFTGFGPRRAAGLAKQPKFFFAIVIWHLNEHSVRVSALNSKILSFSTPLHVVPSVIQGDQDTLSNLVKVNHMGSRANTSFVHQKLTWHMLISYYSKTNRFKVVPGGSRCSWIPSATSSSSTMASTASSSYVHFINIDMAQGHIPSFKGKSRGSSALGLSS